MINWQQNPVHFHCKSRKYKWSIFFSLYCQDLGSLTLTPAAAHHFWKKLPQQIWREEDSRETENRELRTEIAVNIIQRVNQLCRIQLLYVLHKHEAYITSNENVLRQSAIVWKGQKFLITIFRNKALNIFYLKRTIQFEVISG